MGNSYVQKIQKRLQWKFRDPCDKSAEIIRKPSEFSQFCGLGISKSAKILAKWATGLDIKDSTMRPKTQPYKPPKSERWLICKLCVYVICCVVRRAGPLISGMISEPPAIGVPHPTWGLSMANFDPRVLSRAHFFPPGDNATMARLFLRLRSNDGYEHFRKEFSHVPLCAKSWKEQGQRFYVIRAIFCLLCRVARSERAFLARWTSRPVCFAFAFARWTPRPIRVLQRAGTRTRASSGENMTSFVLLRRSNFAGENDRVALPLKMKIPDWILRNSL